MKQSQSSRDPKASDVISSAKDKVAEAFENAAHAATGKAREALHSAQQQVAERSKDLWSDVQESATFQEAIAYVKTNPVNALLITFGLGIIVGMRMRR